MSSRDNILKSIKSNKPTHVDLPKIPLFNKGGPGLSENYEQVLLSNKGIFYRINSVEEITQKLKTQFQEASVICSLVPEIKGNFDIMNVKDPHDLNHLDVAIVKGEIGVAENAAIWLPEENMYHRVLPFISQHLVIILYEEDLVADMHQAYAKININNCGYGVFIAGPSKTADIEQSLVIGAHGPKSLTVFLKRNV